MDDADIDTILQNQPASSDSFGEALFGEDDGTAAPEYDDQDLSDPVAPVAKQKKKKKRVKMSKKQRRKKKRARMIALDSSADDAPTSRKRRRILESEPESDLDLFKQDGEAEAPASDVDLSMGELLDLGEDHERRRTIEDEVDDDISAVKSVCNEEVTMDVRAHEFVSAHPPTMIFRIGKTAATATYVTVAGDLVRDMSCPLHTFRVQVRRIPDSVSDTGDPVFGVLDIEKVVAGPVVDAAKFATAEAVRNSTAIVGDGAIRVGAMRLKRAATSSNYLKNVQNRAAYATKLFGRLATEFPAQAFVTQTALEQFAPADSNALVSWMCRNALEDARFFTAANLVGGAAVRAIGRPSPATQPVWDAIDGIDGAVEKIGGEEAVIDLLKKIHFANQMSEFRATRLHAALGVTVSRNLEDTAECIVRAAAVVHSLPGGTDVQDDRYRNAIVRSEPNAVWPEPMVHFLRWHGLHVDRDDSQRWYACRQRTRQFYNSVVENMNSGTVRFVRAEIDDDHAVADGDHGYVDRVRDTTTEFKHATLVVSKTDARVKYLEYHARGYGAKFMKFQAFHGRAFAPSEHTIIWVDRAHTLNTRELTWMLATWGPVVKAIYLAGSTWAGTTRYESTLFSQLFIGSGVTGRETLTTTLAEYKVAPVGSNPLAEGALNGVVPTIVGRQSSACPPAVTAAFPHARTYSISQLAEAADVRPRAVLVLYDNGWTREDLATVWQHAPAKPNSIWMLGGADWHPALQRSSRSNAGPAALMQKAGVA